MSSLLADAALAADCWLLYEDKDPDEKFQGGSSFMKAAEEGHTEITGLIIDKGVDMEVTNRKGRTALSFAAAPSVKGQERRPTHLWQGCRLYIYMYANACRMYVSV